MYAKSCGPQSTDNPKPWACGCLNGPNGQKYPTPVEPTAHFMGRAHPKPYTHFTGLQPNLSVQACNPRRFEWAGQSGPTRPSDRSDPTIFFLASPRLLPDPTRHRPTEPSPRAAPMPQASSSSSPATAAAPPPPQPAADPSPSAVPASEEALDPQTPAPPPQAQPEAVLTAAQKALRSKPTRPPEDSDKKVYLPLQWRARPILLL